MTSIMFEEFNVPLFYIMNPAVLSAFAIGRITGIVLDSGHSISHLVPFFEGYTINQKVSNTTLAGEYLTKLLLEVLYNKDYRHSTSSEK